MNSDRDAIIIAKNLSLAFQQKEIFSNLNFSIPRGKHFLIKGGSGSGKSSLLKILMGFHPFYSGEIYIKNYSLTKEHVWSIRAAIAYIPQTNPKLDGTLEKIFLDYFSDGMNTRDRFLNNLDRLDLTKDLLKQNFQTLSGGEKRRVLLAMTCTQQKSIALIDEISSGLDQQSLDKVVAFMVNWKKENPKTSILQVNHDSYFDSMSDKSVSFPDDFLGQ